MAGTSLAFEVVVATDPPAAVEETIFSHRFCLDYLHRFAAPAPVKSVPKSALAGVADLRNGLGDGAAVLLVRDPEALLPPATFRVLPELLASGDWQALVPVFNVATDPLLRAAPPFFYHNVRNLIEVSELFLASAGNRVSPLPAAAEWPCVMIRRSALDAADGRLPLDELLRRWTEAGRVGRAEGAYVHRFGDYYAAAREDLIALIPENARRILDIGCARGFLGRTLKQQRACRVTGVEMNRTMAEEAAQHYDRVHNLAVEQVHFAETFEAALCGDLIEHLRDPAAVLAKLHDVLEPGGALIGSVPNVGHWSIVQDLAGGRFELIPVGLLCMSHIRFFTEVELIQLLERTGFACEQLETDRPQPTPSGERFIRMLLEAGSGDEASLRTAEFRFRARRVR